MNFSKGDKVCVSLSILWVFMGTLASIALSADAYSDFKATTFVLLVCTFSTPILVYWLGYWVWGSGYIFRTISLPFKWSWQLLKASTTTAPRNAPAFPWPRYWARSIDMLLCSGLFWVSLAVIAPELAQKVISQFEAYSPQLSYLITLPCVSVLNGIITAIFGNSVGKAILGIKIQPLDESKISLRKHLTRELLVLWRGLGMGIPVVTLLTAYHSQKKLIKGEATSWDKELNTTVVSIRSFPLRTGIGFAISLLFLSGYSYLDINSEEQISAAPPNQILTNKPLSAEEGDKLIEQEILAAAGDLPRMIDEVTRLESISYKNRVIYYHQTVTDRPSSDPSLQNLESLLKKGITKDVCSNADLRRDVLSQGYTMAYSYSGNDGKFVTTIQINLADCNMLEPQNK